MRREFWAAAVAALALVAVGGRAAAVAEDRPTQLRLSWSEEPRTTATVVWQTSAPVEAPVLEFGATPALGHRAAARRARYSHETGVIYEATMRGLAPGSVVHYRAGDAAAGWSAASSFRTAPAAVEDFTFTAFGDHGIGEMSRRNIERVAAEKPAFHLILGDLSYANGNQPVWDQWLLQNEPLTRSVPVMTALGNHENEKIGEERIGYVSYLARFAMPAPEKYYAFDYAGARFITINSDDPTNPEQLAWLDKTLAATKKDPAVRWVVLFKHHPLYSSNVRRLNNPVLIETYRKRFDEGGIDLVLAGHNHNYERSYPLRGETITSRERTRYRRGEGLVFVVSGGGGKSLYQFTPEQPAITAVRESVEHYLRVRVPRRGPLVVEAIRTKDGSLLDRFEIAPRER